MSDQLTQFEDPADEGARHHIVEVSVPAINEAVKPLGDTLPIKSALAVAAKLTKPLSLQDRKTIVDQALRAIDHIYAHLYLKRARHAFDPVAALTRMKRICGQYKTDIEFHTHMLEIFKRLRDIHTGYILPPPYTRMVAFLPFTLARCSDSPEEGSERHAIVAGVMPGIDHDTFVPGVRLVGWNGIPIDEALDRVGADQQGANPDARMAYGCMLMTIRWLGGSVPPEEMWVTLAYLDSTETLREIRFPWRVLFLPETDDPAARAFPPLQALAELNSHVESLPDRPVSVERKALTGRTVARLLYDHPEASEDNPPEKAGRKAGVPLKRTPIKNKYESTFTAETIDCTIKGKSYAFGRIHLHHFIYPNGDDYLDDFLAALDQMPRTGLVIDIRGNGGGQISTAERLVRTLTINDPLRALPFQFRATPTVAQLASTTTFSMDPAELPGWEGRITPLIDDAVQFSLYGYMTRIQDLNAIPKERRYDGPVVLLTDAMTYSAGDMFAASFQDHKIGQTVGVDSNTGGGGANLWFHQTTVAYAEDPSIFRNLPGGVQLHYAVRRCLRIGEHNAGLPFEEDGVRPDVLRSLTEADLTHQARDLLLFSAEKFFEPVG